MKEYKYSIFIGRFQPIHNAHLDLIKKGLEVADKLILIIGSASQARTVRNPWTFEERKNMILSCLSDKEKESVIVRSMKDFYYNDNIWTTNVQKIVKEITQNETRICLLGSYKDSQSYWLSLFPQWDFQSFKLQDVNSTTIRNSYFETDSINCKKWVDHQIEFNIPFEIRDFLIKFSTTTEFSNLKEEFLYIKKYKEQWKSAPFPPTFITTDCVVMCSGHVLIIKRGFNPGKGLYALPGGFLNQEERIEDGAIRELKEETGIKVPKIILKSSIVDSKVFDYPLRSSRGRTITHCYCINLKLDKSGEMPEVMGGSDASSVEWMEFSDVFENQDKFFEDHFHILSYFINKQY